ncbi:MAG: TIGR00159 family protein [Bacteroidetes bacterium]|nr:TIGR00159 family protein [Bacteroidota bacterium]
MLPAFITIRVLDILDIILVAVLLYQLYRLIRGTVAINIFIGIFIVYLFWLVVKALNMELISTIFGQVIGVGVIALIIVFQQEIRRFLLILGSKYISNERFSFDNLFSTVALASEPKLDIDTLIKACKRMSASKTGALIVLKRRSVLSAIIESGDILNADYSSRMLESIFFKNNPLHDGAVIIEGKKIVAARCVLPTSENIYLPARYGMRHRAAIGMTERNDSLVVVVSEETGEISLANSGEIKANLKFEDLKKLLEREL